MKVAIVCANYQAGKSYQENVWAEQLAKAGHLARIFYAGKTDVLEQIEAGPASHEAQRVASKLLPRSTYWSSRVNQLVREYSPDLIVFCGDKTFCMPVCRDEQLAHVPVISTYSENLAMHEFDWRKQGITLKQRAWAVTFALTRGWPIRVACRRSSLVVGNTPQARDILRRLFRKREWPSIDAKMIDMPLGFSPDHFGFDPRVRQRVREELKLGPDDVALCASTHFSAVKEPGIRLMIEALGTAMQRHPALKAVIIGFSDAPEHAAVAARIRQQIDDGPFPDRFIKHPFARRERLCELYNACDIAYFARASISCQEALGTGLAVVLVDDGSMSHLVTCPGQGEFFKPRDQQDLAAAIGRATQTLQVRTGLQRECFRCELAAASRWLAYDRIIEAILNELSQRGHLSRTSLRRASV